MIGLARFLTKGRIQAILSLGLLTILSAVLPPLANLLSGTSVGLITLRQGPQIVFQVMLGALLLLMLMLAISGEQPKTLLLFAVGIWLPVMLASAVLRITQSQGIMLVTAGTIGILFVLYMHNTVDGLAADYRTVIETFWQENILPNLSPNTSAEEVAVMKQLLDNLMPFMNGVRASFLTVGLVLTVLLARWWQAKAFNPGGFRPEFLSLQLPKLILIPLAICAGIVFMGGVVDDSISRDCLMVLMSLYVFQGIACVHAFVARRPEQRGWLFGMYISLIFISLYAVIILSCIGVADSVMGRKMPKDSA